MDLSARVLHDVEFREARKGGYNTQDVDEFLERLAAAIERQEAQLREARQRVAQAESRIADAERRAQEAEERGGSVGSSDADETLKRTLVLAQRTADAAIREAEERAARTIAAAEDEAARMLAEAHDSTAQAYADAEEEARRAQHEARARVVAEMHELESVRDQMRVDVELLERFIGEQRDRIRIAAREMQTLVEDPAALRELAPPAVSDVVVPDLAPPPAPRRLVAEPLAPPEPWSDVDDDDGEVWPEPEPEPTEVRAMPIEADFAPVPPPARPLQAVGGRRGPDEDDAYLAELRKAMTDDRPLGPREDPEGGPGPDAPEGGRSRFGRRR